MIKDYLKYMNLVIVDMIKIEILQQYLPANAQNGKKKFHRMNYLKHTNQPIKNNGGKLPKNEINNILKNQ